MSTIDETTERLIQDVLDGSATSEQQARLRTLLEHDPAVRARHEDLAHVFRTLAEVPRAAAPAGIRDQVLRRIAAATPVRAPGLLASLRAALARRPGLGLAYGFVAGAVIGGAAIGLLAGGPLPGGRGPLPISGTMGPLPAPGAGGRVAHQVLRVGTGNVALETWRDGPTVTVRVDPGTVAGLETEIQFDAQAVAALGVRWSAPGAHVLDVGAGRAVASQTGAEPFELTLHAPAGGTPLHVRLARPDGSASAECTLATGRS